MSASTPIPRQFYDRPALQVARDLIGMRLVRLDDSARISGTILETEAYSGEEDLGCHCKAGRTSRTEVMYGPAGHAYVYFTYGMHWMFNIVVERQGYPAAILIRSIQVTEGSHLIAERRGSQPPKHWTDGPGKLCKALHIDSRFNGADICDRDGVLFIEFNQPVPDERVTIGPRVGLNNVPEPWKSMPWRFLSCSKVESISQK